LPLFVPSPDTGTTLFRQIAPVDGIERTSDERRHVGTQHGFITNGRVFDEANTAVRLCADLLRTRLNETQSGTQRAASCEEA
jgi:hypothetical protein